MFYKDSRFSQKKSNYFEEFQFTRNKRGKKTFDLLQTFKHKFHHKIPERISHSYSEITNEKQKHSCLFDIICNINTLQ